MANSEQLRKNINQHQPKNNKSKKDDKLIYKSMFDVKNYLETRFLDFFKDKKFYVVHETKLTIGFMKEIIYKKGVRKTTDDEKNKKYDARYIKPDGGVLLLKSHLEKDFCKVLLVSEVKRQGTNDQRQKEGKNQQSQGNAIERLGKNLTAIKTMFMHESITPFICFNWGFDFSKKYSIVDTKLFTLNEFFDLNKIFVFKKHGNNNHNYFSPVSIYFRESPWNRKEMFELLKEVAETAFRYYTQ